MFIIFSIRYTDFCSFLTSIRFLLFYTKSNTELRLSSLVIYRHTEKCETRHTGEANLNRIKEKQFLSRDFRPVSEQRSNISGLNGILTWDLRIFRNLCGTLNRKRKKKKKAGKFLIKHISFSSLLIYDWKYSTNMLAYPKQLKITMNVNWGTHSSSRILNLHWST